MLAREFWFLWVLPWLVDWATLLASIYVLDIIATLFLIPELRGKALE